MNKKESNGKGTHSKNGNFELAEAPALPPATKGERKTKGTAKEALEKVALESGVYEQLTGQVNYQQLLHVLTSVRNGSVSETTPANSALVVAI